MIGFSISRILLDHLIRDFPRIFNDIITSIEYAELFNCSHRTARMDLKGLVDLGIFEKKGKGNQIHYILNRAYRQLPAMVMEIEGM